MLLVSLFPSIKNVVLLKGCVPAARKCQDENRRFACACSLTKEMGIVFVFEGCCSEIDVHWFGIRVVSEGVVW